MARYLISFDPHAMDHIPDEDMPPVAEAAQRTLAWPVSLGQLGCRGERVMFTG